MLPYHGMAGLAIKWQLVCLLLSSNPVAAGRKMVSGILFAVCSAFLQLSTATKIWKTSLNNVEDLDKTGENPSNKTGCFKTFFQPVGYLSRVGVEAQRCRK